MRRADDPPEAWRCRAEGDGGLLRRRFLSAGAAAFGVAAAGCAALPPRHQRRLRLTLPPPSGPYRVGTVSLHLVDHSRPDPWLAGTRPRELMVSLWYPARDDDRYPRAAWMPPKAGALFLAQLIPSSLTGPATAPPARLPPGRVRLPVTRARQASLARWLR